MSYNKPKVKAKSAKKSSFVAGCPANLASSWQCMKCERTK